MNSGMFESCSVLNVKTKMDKSMYVLVSLSLK